MNEINRTAYGSDPVDSFAGEPGSRLGYADAHSGGSPADSGQVASQAQEVSQSGDGGQGSSMLNNVTDKVSGMADQAKPAVDSGIEKAAGGLQTAAETLRQRGESMGEGQVANAAVMAAEKFEAGANLLSGTDTDAMIVELENMVRRKPVESMLVAAGIGFLLAKAVR